MVTVPGINGLTIPVAPIYATEISLLTHVPPVAVSARVIEEPIHTAPGPVIVPAEGSGVMVTTWLAIAVPQMPETEYIMVSVPPETPVTIPPVTVAVALLLLHTPPVVVSVKVIVAPAHRLDAPVIEPATGNGLMVMV